MQKLEQILKEKNTEPNCLDGLCILYTVSCAPATLESAPSPAPVSGGLMSTEVLSYLKNMGDQFGVPSPAAAPETISYKPAINQDLIDYAKNLGEQMGIPSPAITPTTMNSRLSDYGGYLSKQMGVASPPKSSTITSFEPQQISPEIIDYAGRLNNVFGVKSIPLKPIEASVPPTSFNPQQTLNLMKETASSYLSNPSNQIGIVSQPITPKYGYESTFETPKFETMPSNFESFRYESAIPKFEITREPILNKPKSDNSYGYIEKKNFHFPESDTLRINLGKEDYKNPYIPDPVLEIKPRIDFTGHNDTKPHINLDYGIRYNITGKFNRLNKEFVSKGFLHFRDLFGDKDDDAFKVSFDPEVFKPWKKK